MSIFNKIFLSENDRNVKKIKKIADKVLELDEQFSKKSDEELKNLTATLKERYQQGESLDSLLPEAFANCREAAYRVLKMKHFPVQVMGGVCLHQGRIAEMHTGEGKTLVATLPAYLNALAGRGVFVVTVNDYLASRDAQWMGKIYKFLGLTVGVVVSGMKPEEKKKAYSCDIIYATNNELGFDYLRDNMVLDKDDKVQKDLYFAIVDEVDSILIDEARTPLIISGAGSKSSDMYVKANRFVKGLNEEDYFVEEKDKTVNLTEEGVAKAELYFKLENLADPNNTDLVHHIRQALKANIIMKKDSDYIVSDGEVLIVDEYTGRIMIGRRYSDGLHQAIEAKENVAIRAENKTMATITFQNYFRLFEKLSGMTGTAKTEEEEFKGIYGLDVVVLPTNLPVKRIDENDVIYPTVKGKIKCIIEDIKECYDRGQPVLVGTITVEKSEALAKELRREKIPCKVLNAKNHVLEAEIVAQAGKKGAVTIATNMAGRGTDILLGGNPEFLAKEEMQKLGYELDIIEQATSFATITDEQVLKARKKYNELYAKYKEQTDKEKAEVKAVGGLRIIGTERHESRRIDNQLRGRAGRQGDEGSSIFYISMEDDLTRLFGGDKMKAVAETLHAEEDMPITNAIISKSIERAQKSVEGRNYSIRKQVLAYDNVMNKQREIIYQERNKILDGVELHSQLLDMINPIAQNVVGYYADYDTDFNEWDYDAFNRAIEARLLDQGTNFMTPKKAAVFDVYKLSEMITEEAIKQYEAKIERAKEQGIDFTKIERFIMLKVIDTKWMAHIDDMDVLRHGIGLRAYGQRDPVVAYQKEGFDMFEEMLDAIKTDTVCFLLKVSVEEKEQNQEEIVKNSSAKHAKKTVGRNDPCPCGSGKKYKNCCGKNL